MAQCCRVLPDNHCEAIEAVLSDGDKQYLESNLRRNRVVLFLGAGFSRDATNSAGAHIPLSQEVAETLWKTAKFPGEYDGTELRYLYDAARKRQGDGTIRRLLQELLLVSKYPDWYRSVAGWYWRRIYTTNIDNLIEAIYGGTAGLPFLERVIPPDEFSDRDAFLRRIQCIKLHGSADDLGKPIVFSPIEYGRRASLHDVWYDHFLRDYSTYPTLLVGTELNEPLFWQYLAARQEKPRGAPESRPKSFLVSPNISRARSEALSVYNIEPIDGTAEQFFQWISQLDGFSSPRESVLLEVDPTLEHVIALEREGASRVQVSTAECFFGTFEQVQARPASASARRDFLLGVQPGWDDIVRGLDADREINKLLKDSLKAKYTSEQRHVPVLVLHGSAGSGKTTSAMRVAYTMALEGVPTYFATGRNRPDPRQVCEYIRGLTARPILIFDNAAPDVNLIDELKTSAEKLPIKPLLLVTLRSNQWFQKRYVFQDYEELSEIGFPDLSAYDIQQILTVLERESFLGALLKLSPDERFEIFSEKARKQILVAMREATKGKPFDEILRDEYNCIAPSEARLLFLIAAIPSMRQYHVGFGELVSAMDLPPAETGALLRQALSGIVVPHPQQNDRFAVRHPVIAEFVVSEVANPETLADAYARYLEVLAHEINLDRDAKTSRTRRLCRDLINHENLRNLFPRYPHLVRQVYDAVRDHFGHDGHFWLQYGVYEVEFGHLDLAENYLLQAQGLIPHSEPLTTAFGHLHMRKAIESESLVVAIESMSEGEKILRAQIGRIGSRDPYPWHVFGSQMFGYIKKWVPEDERPEAFHKLYDELKPGVERHRLAAFLRPLLADIKRAELDSVSKPGAASPPT
jgi:hypothetical protein